MRFIKIYTTLFFIFSICFVSFAQIGGDVVEPREFDRLYRLRPDRAMFGQSIQQLTNDNYVTLSTVDTMFTGDAVITHANITRFTDKGNIITSLDYAFEDTLDLYPVGNVLSTEDRYFFSTATKVDTNSITDSIHTNIVVALDKGGNPVWSKKFGSGVQGDPNLLGRVDILSPNDSTLILMGNAFTDTTSAMLLSALRMDDGELIWSKSMNLPNTTVFSEARNMTLSKDSTLIITGSARNFDNFYISELDPTTGDVAWSELYDASGGLLSEDYSFIANDIAIGNDSSLVATGIVTNGNINLNEGYVASFDKTGEFQWAQTFSLGAGTISNGFSIDVLISGNIAVMVGGQNNDAGIYFPTQFIISPTGALITANDYSIFLNSTSNNAQLIATSDRGSIFMGSGIEHGINVTQGTDVGFFYPRLIKTDEMGVSKCENLITPTLNPLFLEADTLIWESQEDTGQSDSIGISVSLYNGFTAPILSIPDTMFCPGDPVMYLMDATTRGATQYAWSTADAPNDILSTDSTYIATELDVQYIARVFIEEDLCFELCDTIILTDIDPPTVQLQVDDTRFCEERLFDVEANIQGGFETIRWSTGADDDGKRTIVVSEESTYSITVTNMCDDSGNASVQTVAPLPSELIITTPTDFCNTVGGAFLGLANDDITNITWSTGETTDSIRVDGVGTYTATALDRCGFEISDEVTVSPEDLDCVCVEFPKAFFPGAMDPDDINKVFGPVTKCNDITNYNLRIFNRWGQKVFESNDIDLEWNGQNGSTELRGDVYVYVASYENSGETFRLKGDVTLLK